MIEQGRDHLNLCVKDWDLRYCFNERAKTYFLFLALRRSMILL